MKNPNQPSLSRSITRPITRRQFGKLGAATAAIGTFPGRVLGANEKVNVAIIGCGGMGAGDGMAVHRTGLVNVVALCDVAIGTDQTKGIEEKFPGVPRYKDFRVMFDEMHKDIDACTIGVPDHAHFPIAMLAMSLGKGVYVEKPLAHTYEEIKLLIAAEKKYGVACQMGNQGHSGANYHQFKAWREAGVIAGVTQITAYMNGARRWHGWDFDAYPTDQVQPEGLDWDTWLGTAPQQPYSDKLHPGNWRSWYDYGTGAFGDWGPHILDTVHRFLDLGMPHRIEAVMREGPKENIFPLGTTIQFDFPERGDEPACSITWHDGVGNRPERPEEFGPDFKPEPPAEGQDPKTIKKPRQLGRAGKIIRGKDLVFAGKSHGSPLDIIPEEKAKELEGKLPGYEVGSNHHLNFIRAVKGEEQTRSPFHVSGPLCQMFCLGVIAQRLGGELTFDREKEVIVGNDRAHALLAGPPPRKGWEQYYEMA